MDAKLKHLEMIQGVINRMAHTSLLLKGWSVTLISAFAFLVARYSNPSLMVLAYFPLLAFWSLDSYFLWQEKMYRKLYEKVATTNVGDINFDMDATKFKDDVHSLIRVGLTSNTIWLFHLAFFVVICLVLANPDDILNIETVAEEAIEIRKGN